MLSLIPSAAVAAQAWKKKTTAWSLDDARSILNRSPWAQVAKVDFKIEGKQAEGPRSGGIVGPPEGPPGGNGTVGPPGGAPARAGGGIVQNGPGVLPEFKALVRWESALPVRLAQGLEGSLDASQYVISVTGFPVMRSDVANSLPLFKNASRLERAREERLRAVRVESRESGGALVLVFTFDGAARPLSLEDREVLFVTRLGSMDLRVKFNLKDMMFERKLAV